MHRLNLAAKLLLQRLEEGKQGWRHLALTTRSAALWIRLNNGAGIQKPRTMITVAKPRSVVFFHQQVSPGGSPGSGPRTKLAMCTRNPEKIATRKETKRIAGKR